MGRVWVLYVTTRLRRDSSLSSVRPCKGRLRYAVRRITVDIFSIDYLSSAEASVYAHFYGTREEEHKVDLGLKRSKINLVLRLHLLVVVTFSSICLFHPSRLSWLRGNPSMRNPGASPAASIACAQHFIMFFLIREIYTIDKNGENYPKPNNHKCNSYRNL